MNIVFVNICSVFKVMHLGFGLFDHRCISTQWGHLSIHNFIPAKRYLLCFDMGWTNFDDCKTIVENIWRLESVDS